MFTTDDGRVLSYDDVGDPDGTPVVYLHGTPDSRLARHPDDSLVGQAGVRLLAVDRPGYGGTTAPAAGDTTGAVLDQFAADLARLLDQLGLTRAGLLAWSGGALAAVSAAASPALTGRLTGLTVVAGVVPREAFTEPAVRAAASGHSVLMELADDMAAADFAEMVAPMFAPYPCDEALAAEHQREHRNPGDQAALAGIPGGVERMVAALVEAVRRGLAGVAFDAVAQHYPDTVPGPGQVEIPVRLYYGSDDEVTPPELGRWYQRHLPQADLEVVEGAGHLVFLTHWRHLLTRLAAT